MSDQVTSSARCRHHSARHPVPAPGKSPAALPLADVASFISKSRAAVRKNPTPEFQAGLPEFQAGLLTVMRARPGKPRTAADRTGVINGPHLDGTCDMAAGPHATRALLRVLAVTGMPASCEQVDPRPTRGRTSCLVKHTAHRHLASGPPMPADRPARASRTW